MKKAIKTTVIVVISLVLTLALLLAAWVFLIYPNFVAPKEEIIETTSRYSEIADKSDKIDFDQSNGMLYINNEVVVIVKSTASDDEISALFSSYGAKADNKMADIDVYRLVFEKAMTYEELESLVKKIGEEDIVENAYINTVNEFEEDAIESDDDFEYKDKLYPNDPWKNDEWNVDIPKGKNWGVEAIDAPGAWGYLDQMSTVKVGLIDSFPNTSHEDLSFKNTSCLFIDDSTGDVSLNNYSLTAEDHGSHVSGIMNATFNNDKGVSGVMGGKGELYYSAVNYVNDGDVYGRYATAYSYLLALKTLIDQDVQVINISQNTCRLIGFAASHGNENAINYLTIQAELTESALKNIISTREAAGKPDFVICVAAGNSNDTYYYKDDTQTYGYRENITLLEIAKLVTGWRGEKGNSLALYNNFLNLMDDETVKSRVIVVGAVEIDKKSSTKNHTIYSYADFSNVGSRVDIVAPGVDIYSCEAKKYALMSGTSMSSPHVAGVAGLIFACNPELSGPEVKSLLLASTTGRYYYGEDYSGLLNANISVVNALKTKETSVEKVIKAEVDNGLDLCFVIDTTNSMEDDIDNAKNNMTNILNHLGEKTENYRVSLIDYRDYPERTSDSGDYPCKVQLYFTNDNEAITNAIYNLDLGYGGDNEETVYSALMSAVDLDWRSNAKKVIIILGDAAPLDPEPISNLTYEDVLSALLSSRISIDFDQSDDRVTEAMDESMINVFSIGANADSSAEDFFKKISGNTGGSYASVDDASQVSDAIIDSIDQIEVTEKLTVLADFGEFMANQKINLYSGEDFLFTIETDEKGQAEIESIEVNTYNWTSNSLYSSGSISVSSGNQNASVSIVESNSLTPLLKLWYQHNILICIAFIAYLAICIAIPILVSKLRRSRIQKNKALEVADEMPVQNSKTIEAEKKPASTTDSISTDNEISCPNCGLQTSSNTRFCKHCGYDLHTDSEKSKERICKNCGQLCNDDETYCGKCGAKIE